MSALYGMALYNVGVDRGEYAFSVVSDGENIQLLVDPMDGADEEILDTQEQIYKAMRIRLEKMRDGTPEGDLEAISYNMPFSIITSDEYESFDDAMEEAKKTPLLRSEVCTPRAIQKL